MAFRGDTNFTFRTVHLPLGGTYRLYRCSPDLPATESILSRGDRNDSACLRGLPTPAVRQQRPEDCYPTTLKRRMVVVSLTSSTEIERLPNTSFEFSAAPVSITVFQSRARLRRRT